MSFVKVRNWTPNKMFWKKKKTHENFLLWSILIRPKQILSPTKSFRLFGWAAHNCFLYSSCFVLSFVFLPYFLKTKKNKQTKKAPVLVFSWEMKKKTVAPVLSDINECLDPSTSQSCSPQLCTNTPGSFQCVCPTGTQFVNLSCIGELQRAWCPHVEIKPLLLDSYSNLSVEMIFFLYKATRN